jgi:hypothetical protein
MSVLTMTLPDVREFRPTLVLQLRDAFSDSHVLQGQVTITVGKNSPLFQKQSEATFVFANLPNGNYTAKVSSTADQPYYLPVSIPITLPFPAPTDSPWPEPWPGYPNAALADPSLTLDDPGQSAAYLAQRELTGLQPSTSYPFPSGTTLVRGRITVASAPVSGALVSLALLAETGAFPVVVVNPDGTASAAKNLTVVNTPVVDALLPAVVIAAGPTFTLTVKGTGFVAGATVRLAGVALPTTFLSGAALSADVPHPAVLNAGQFAVVVANPDGTVSNQQMLTVTAAPVLAAIAPSSVSAGSAAFTLVVQGSGFAANATIQLQGVSIKTKFVSSTELTADISAAQIALPAQLNVTVANPGPPQQISSALPLSIVSAPVIASLQPSTVVARGPAFTLLVLGTGYVADSVVKLGGVGLNTEYGDSTELVAAVMAAEIAVAGNLVITVSNPNGSSSVASVLAVVAGPTIASIDPTSVTTGSAALTLVVKGAGFLSGSIVELDGTELATSFVSSTELHAHVPRSGYTTGIDGTYVLYFDEDEFDAIAGRSQTVTLVVTRPGSPAQTKQGVTVIRGATVSCDIDIT